MLVHRSFVIPFTKIQCFLILNKFSLNKFKTLNTTVQVLDMIWMINEIIQANLKKKFELFTLNTKVQVLEKIFMLKITISNISKSYSMYIDYKQKN